MSMQEVIVVLEPVRQDIIWDHTPASFPHLQHTRGIRAAQSPKSTGEQPSPGMLLGERKFGFSDIKCPLEPCKPPTHILHFAPHNPSGNNSQSPQGMILSPPQFPQGLTASFPPKRVIPGSLKESGASNTVSFNPSTPTHRLFPVVGIPI